MDVKIYKNLKSSDATARSHHEDNTKYGCGARPPRERIEAPLPRSDERAPPTLPLADIRLSYLDRFSGAQVTCEIQGLVVRDNHWGPPMIIRALRKCEFAPLIPVLLLSFSTTVAAQTAEPAKFDVSSVRAVSSQELRAAANQGFAGISACNGMFELTPGRITITAVTVFRLIAAAYGQPCGAALDLKLIVGGPDWVQRDAFHVQATMAAGAPNYTIQQLQNGEAPVLQEMLRSLLVERFHLTLLNATKVVSTYNIYSQKEVKVKPSVDQTSTELSLVSGSRGNFDMALDRNAGIVRLRATAIPMSRLITPMQGRDSRMVIDRTGMTGIYDIPPMAIDVGPAAPGVSVWPQILGALGFKVESARGPVNFHTIEHVELPSEN